MSDHPTGSIVEHPADMEDPRTEYLCERKLIDIITIATCAVFCGADNWVEVEAYGKATLHLLQTFLELPNGIPSHDTIGRIFACLDAEQFRDCFLNWTRSVSEFTEGQVVAIDGKTSRRSHDRTLGTQALHMVSSWATANRLVLAQTRVEEKSNEITAIPELPRIV